MQIYGPDTINFDGVNGDRYWFYQPYPYTGIKEIDERLSGFPVAVFLPHRPTRETPLVIGLQGMSAPYGWNAFIVPTLTQMGIAVALFDTPLAGERSLVRTFTAVVQNEIQPLINQGIAFDTALLLSIFRNTASNIDSISKFCSDRYGLSNSKLALFGVSMGVLLSGYAFTAQGLGERLLGTIGHTDLQSFANSWGYGLLPDLAASPLGGLATALLQKVQPDLQPVVKLLQLAKNLKYHDEYAWNCNPMNYVEQVQLPRKVRFLVGANDPIVRIKDTRACAQKFPDGACYVVPGMGHGTRQWGATFVDHVRYFLATQLGDWCN
ncbi:alpha/beta hydrolase [Calothrix sp. FACHB-1219]|uniref:alpha/beta hydrolase n=1 Tax=unclassified Calothrix TaxID=2619626 RepID=UPI001683751B|nr:MULTISPECIES: alpha/beta hydrolase [unclassified Calothrix]MBD2204330.1 alpha/beta hydrolase [Calothrix sp. FACHB-168]MBD2221853.1 alpha/beta hydrolase [Calothrix sp. FACHB-1219]